MGEGETLTRTKACSRWAVQCLTGGADPGGGHGPPGDSHRLGCTWIQHIHTLQASSQSPHAGVQSGVDARPPAEAPLEAFLCVLGTGAPHVESADGLGGRMPGTPPVASPRRPLLTPAVTG